MVRSMTAYGKAEIIFEHGRYNVEIKSVNRKHLDINLLLPRELSSFEIEVRKQISQVVRRGRLSVTITSQYDAGTVNKITANLPLVRQLKDVWRSILDELDYEGDINPILIAKETGVMHHEQVLGDEAVYKAALEVVLDQALDELLASKEREGAILQDDFEKRLSNLKGSIIKIEELASDSVDEYRNKLRKVLEETLPGAIENDERILRELLLYTDKVDVSEEITRFNGVLDEFRIRLNSDKDAIGKTLDFVLQELNREINTISSKSVNLEITKLVVDVKTEIERIREQVQNVE